MFKILQDNLQDFIELMLLPALAVVLPWSLCFRLFRRLARLSCCYPRQTTAMLNGAQSVGLAQDSRAWCSGYRLVQLVDHADLYLSLFRSDRWLTRYLTVQGDAWPKQDAPCLAFTFHWGAGLWIFRYLRRQGIQAACLFRHSDSAMLAGQPLRRAYYRWRVWEVERGGNTPAVFTGHGNISNLLDTLKQGRTVVALPDVPPEGSMKCLPVCLLGRQAWLPSGLLRLAVARKIPVMAYTFGFNRKTGQRILNIKGPLPNHDEQSLINALNQLLIEALENDPTAWHFWAFVQQFLRQPNKAPETTGREA
jgi:lauroyl/myristoyl acyltransferase